MSPHERIVVIGASAGGIAALRRLLGGLDRRFGWPLAIVLHTGSADFAALLDVLGAPCALPLSEARHGEAITGGHVYLAPSGYHLLTERDHRFALSVDEKVCFARPSIDVLFSSAADAYGAGAIGTVLTGTNDDGARGLADIRRQKGLALVQALDDAEEPAMPAAALQVAGADALLDADALAQRLNLEFLQCS
jgi:two-component system chemotaxis response regulator CheB